jgi:hypothetical protein
LVDKHPSLSIRSNVRRTAARKAPSTMDLSTDASVVKTLSMVARLGASMPAPLAMPPSVQPSGWMNAACLASVSVVRIASAAASP